MRPPPAPERAWAILSDCWVAEVGTSGARPLGMVALDGNWVLDVEEEEPMSLSVGAGAMVFVSDILDGEGRFQRLVADTGNDQLARCRMLEFVGRLVF
jgi:hypothetical protein